MDVIDHLHAHRSIRRFRPGPVPTEDIRRAANAGQMASTSSAIQAYCVLNVTDAARRTRLVELTGGQRKVADAGAFLVICGDTRRHRLAVESAGRQYDARFEAFLLAAVDASLFAQNMVVAFEALGYGICYIGGLRNDLDAVDELLSIPEGVYPFFGLCVGVPDEAPMPRPRMDVDAILFQDTYPDDARMRVHLEAYDQRYRAYLHERGVAASRISGWSDLMADMFAEPRRGSVGPHYRSKGADFR